MRKAAAVLLSHRALSGGARIARSRRRRSGVLALWGQRRYATPAACATSLAASSRSTALRPAPPLCRLSIPTPTRRWWRCARRLNPRATISFSSSVAGIDAPAAATCPGVVAGRSVSSPLATIYVYMLVCMHCMLAFSQSVIVVITMNMDSAQHCFHETIHHHHHRHALVFCQHPSIVGHPGRR